jgi:acyl-CoA thioester hydrolase
VEGFRFSTDLRVRFNETDAQGIVHNSAYLVWLEIARIDYLARFPGGYKGIVEEHGVDVTTVEAHVRYRAPTRFDDQLRIWARTAELRGTRFRFEYVIERLGEAPSVVAEGWTLHACVNAKTLRPVRMPAWLADALVQLEAEARG